MSDGLQELAATIATYEKRLHSSKHDAGAVIGLLTNWQVPILKDFGQALEQVIAALTQVAGTAEAALNLADQTFCGETLSAAANLTEDLKGALHGVDMPDEARDVLASLIEALDPWLGDDEDDTEEDGDEEIPENVVVAPVEGEVTDEANA